MKLSSSYVLVNREMSMDILAGGLFDQPRRAPRLAPTHPCRRKCPQLASAPPRFAPHLRHYSQHRHAFSPESLLAHTTTRGHKP